MNIHNIVSNLPLLTEFPSRKQWEAAVWEIIVDRLAEVRSATELKKILRFLLSSRERQAMTYRALTASRFQSSIGMREISRELWLARSTISAIKKSLFEDEYKSSHARGHQKKKYSPI